MSYSDNKGKGRLTSGKLPLEGVRVAEITVVWAGPYSTMFLADWGAEVIRVESTQHWQQTTRGITARPSPALIKESRNLDRMYVDKDPGERPWNRSSFFNGLARNKLGMTVDLTRPEGREVFKRLIQKSDIFIESNAPKVMRELNLTYDVVREWKSDLIMVSLSGLGQTGPYRDYRAYGPGLGGFMGNSYLLGYPDVDLAEIRSNPLTDAEAGVIAAFAILAALRYRNHTGKGQFIDISQLETTLPFLGQAIMDYTMNGRVQERMGNRHPSAVQGCYRCLGEDAWINITICNDGQWLGFCRALANPSWTKEDRFSDTIRRYQNHNDLDRYIEEWTSKRDPYEVMHLLQKEGIPAGPVLSERDAYSDPHINERGFFEELTQEDSGTHRYPGLAWKMSKTPNHLRLPPVMLGEHNEYVYKKLLGYSDEEYAELERLGHIGTEPLPGIT